MIRDFHVHMHYGPSAKECVKYFNLFKEKNNIEHITLQSIPLVNGHECICRMQNLKILMAKDMMYPYAFAGMGIYSGEGHLPFKEQLEIAINQGFDCVKMLEGKPDTRKAFGIPICDESLDPFYNLIEEKGLVLLMHLADPFESWNKETCDKWALEHGRCYDAPEFLKPRELYEEAISIIEKHPKLKIAFAHFFFLGEYLDEAAWFLDKYPNVMFDLTPGKHYEIFSKPEYNKKAKAFYEKYAHRLIFGTDVNDSLANSNSDGAYHDALYKMSVGMLTGEPIPPFRNNKYVPFNLSKEICNQILYENHRRLLGENPKPVNVNAVLDELMLIEKDYDSLNDVDKAAFKEVKEYFENRC